jgi:hypothetical protein
MYTRDIIHYSFLKLMKKVKSFFSPLTQRMPSPEKQQQTESAQEHRLAGNYLLPGQCK